MCLALGLTSPSMYARARLAVGSLGLTLPERKRPVRATPVTPGLLAVLQPPFFSWLSLRNSIAFWTTAFQRAASTGGGEGPGFSFGFPPGARLPSASAQAAA